MCKIFHDYEAVIRDYCFANGLNDEKVFHSPRSFNNDLVFVQYHDPQKGKGGLRDETPAPVTLKIFKTDNGLVFEQTEHTHKYLS